MAHDVFISHSVKDKTTADAVCAMLESNGVRCWIAPRDVTPGMEWGECIIDAIEECRIMVLVFTAHANDSSQIRREVERAVNHGVVILPLRLEDIIPAKALEYFIGNVHWLDALTPPMESHLTSLAGTVKMFLARLSLRDAVPILPVPVAPLKSEVAEPAPPPKTDAGPHESPPKEPSDEKEAAFKAQSSSRQVPPSRWGSRAFLILIAAVVVAALVIFGVIYWPQSGAQKSAVSQGQDRPAPPSIPSAAQSSPPEGTSGDLVHGSQIGAQPQSSGGKGSAPTPSSAQTEKNMGPTAGSAENVSSARTHVAQAPVQTPQDDSAQSPQAACDSGNAQQCTILGNEYQSGMGSGGLDVGRAARLYQKGCDGGDGRGCNNLALMYTMGIGVAINKDRAASLFHKGCELGYPQACGPDGK